MRFILPLTLVACGSLATAQSFVDRTLAAGITHEQADYASIPALEYFHMTGGAAAADYDKDGWCDLFVTRLEGKDILYRNLGTSAQGEHLGFEDVTDSAFTNQMVVENSNGAAWGDVDDDGHLDLFVTSIFTDAYRLYMNDGTGHFVEQGLARGAALADGNTHTTVTARRSGTTTAKGTSTCTSASGATRSCTRARTRTRSSCATSAWRRPASSST